MCDLLSGEDVPSAVAPPLCAVAGFGIGTVQIARHITAQGPIIQRHENGLATIDCSGVLLTGSLICRWRVAE